MNRQTAVNFPARKASGKVHDPDFPSVPVERGAIGNTASACAEHAHAPETPDKVDSTWLAELLRVHEYERQRMGNDLHDSAGQLLISLELSLSHLKEVEGNCGHQALIEEIQETVQLIDNEIRTLAFLDYPAALGEDGLYSALRSLARGLERRTGIQTSVEALGDLTAANDEISATLLRVAQEALVNIHRHAHASLAKIVIERRGNCVELSVVDDGIGIEAASQRSTLHGIGLQGMRHRVEIVGGKFKITNLKPGTRVSACVPIAA